MKQLIVLIAMIGLGIFIFQIIAGDGEDSFKNTLSSVWQQEIEERTRKD